MSNAHETPGPIVRVQRAAVQIQTDERFVDPCVGDHVAIPAGEWGPLRGVLVGAENPKAELPPVPHVHVHLDPLTVSLDLFGDHLDVVEEFPEPRGGKEPRREEIPCPQCHGTGVKREPVEVWARATSAEGIFGMDIQSIRCERCLGFGGGVKCRACDGRGGLTTRGLQCPCCSGNGFHPKASTINGFRAGDVRDVPLAALFYRLAGDTTGPDPKAATPLFGSHVLERAAIAAVVRMDEDEELIREVATYIDPGGFRKGEATREAARIVELQSTLLADIWNRGEIEGFDEKRRLRSLCVQAALLRRDYFEEAARREVGAAIAEGVDCPECLGAGDDGEPMAPAPCHVCGGSGKRRRAS